MISSLFINPQEHRLRAGWRLLLHAAFYFGLVLFGTMLVGVVAGIGLLLSGADMTDPNVIAGLATNPLIRVASGLISLFVIFLSYWIFARWIDRRPFADFGFHLKASWWIDLGFGLFLGAFLMVLIFAVEMLAGWITIDGFFESTSPGTPFLLAVIADLILFLCVGIYEEMLSRGYQIKNLAEGLNFRFFGPRTALLLAYLGSSIFFGLLHAGNPGATFISTINLIIAGLFLGLGYVLTGELAIPMGLHITWNFFQGTVFGFPVSGTLTAATAVAIRQNRPELWTGGVFGPEAGLIGLAAIALGSLMIIGWVRLRHGSAAISEVLALYRPRQPKTVETPAPVVPPAPIQ